MTMALEEAAKGGGTNNTKSPDPTNATTQMILREIGALKELTGAQFDTISQRIGAIDRSIDLAHEDYVRWPTDLEREIGTLTKVFDTKLAIRDERFGSIDKQFCDRDQRFTRGSIDNKSAVDSALNAAKEAVGKQQEANDRANTKSENSFSKQIEQQAELLDAYKSELGGRIDTLKESHGRLSTDLATIQQASVTRIESNRDSRDQRTDSRENLGAWVAGGVAFITVVISAVGLILSR